MEPKSEFEREVRKHCEEFGGIGNFHIHGDRAYTRRDDYYKHIGKSISELDRLTLPEKQRLVLSLYYYEDLNLKEIGQVLDVTESRVSQLHTQAIMKLRNKLKHVFDSPEDLVG